MIPLIMPQDNYEEFLEVDKKIPIFTKEEAVKEGYKWYKVGHQCSINHKDFDMLHPEYRWLSGGCMIYYLFKRTLCPRCKAPKKIYRIHYNDPDYICADCRRELKWASVDEITRARSCAATYIKKYKKQIEYKCEILKIQCEPASFEVHHKDSVNTHPELAADSNNMVGLYKPIHSNFHKI